MVAKFWMTTNQKRHLKSEFALFQTLLVLFISFNLSNVREISGVNPKGWYLSLQKRKENCFVVFNYSIKRAHEIRRFHFAV